MCYPPTKEGINEASGFVFGNTQDMSGSLAPVLRSSPGPRIKICVQLLPRTSTSWTTTTRRAFNNTLPRCKQRKGPIKSRTTAKSSPRTTQAQPSRTLANPIPPTLPAQSKVPNHGSVLDQLLQLGDQVLLYRAPNNHRSFTFLSITSAGLMTFGAYQTAKLYFTDETPEGSKPLNPFVRALGFIPALFLAFGSYVLYTAPSRLIKTITLVGPHVRGVNERAQPILRCVATTPLPFLKPQVIECSPGRVFASRTVRAVSSEKGFKWTNIELAASSQFTQSEHGPDARSTSISSSKPSIRNFWPATKLQVRRMCLREGFYNIRFPEQGSWKVDLQGAEVLQNAHPLAAMMTYEMEEGRGWISRLADAFRSGGEAGASAVRARKSG